MEAPKRGCEVTYPQELGVKTNTWLQTHACENRARDLTPKTRIEKAKKGSSGGQLDEEG